jgi:hypothetical protein
MTTPDPARRPWWHSHEALLGALALAAGVAAVFLLPRFSPGPGRDRGDAAPYHAGLDALKAGDHDAAGKDEDE